MVDKYQLMVDGITDNEAKVMDHLVRNFHERISINEIARRLDISPQGSMKILRKLHAMQLALPEISKNGIFYKPDLREESSKKLFEFILLKKGMDNYAKVYAVDLKQLQPYALGCVLFGSVLEKGKDARDIDVLLIIEKSQFKELNKHLNEFKEMSAKKIHDIMVAPAELKEGILKKQPVFLDILKKGAILWGAQYFVEAVKDGTR